jgi:hypothetical protein
VSLSTRLGPTALTKVGPTSNQPAVLICRAMNAVGWHLGEGDRAGVSRWRSWLPYAVFRRDLVLVALSR